MEPRTEEQHAPTFDEQIAVLKQEEAFYRMNAQVQYEWRDRHQVIGDSILKLAEEKAEERSKLMETILTERGIKLPF